MLHDRTVAGGRRVKKLVFPSTVGDLEGVLFCRVDEEPAAVAVFCHPHPQFGGTMHNRATYRASDALFRLGLAVLRFNFRGVGRSAGVWTGGEGEEEDAEGAISFLLERYPERPVLLAGFSFGAGVALTVGARDERVRAMIALAPSPGRRDFSFLGQSPKPKGVIQGTDDELCPLTDLLDVYPSWAQPKTMRLISGATHLFEEHIAELQNAVTDVYREDPFQEALFGKGATS
jgi:alpha/beta superfamily hydrolase